MAIAGKTKLSLENKYPIGIAVIITDNMDVLPSKKLRSPTEVEKKIMGMNRTPKQIARAKDVNMKIVFLLFQHKDSLKEFGNSFSKNRR